MTRGGTRGAGSVASRKQDSPGTTERNPAWPGDSDQEQMRGQPFVVAQWAEA